MKRKSRQFMEKKVWLVKPFEHDQSAYEIVHFEKQPPWPLRLLCCPICGQRHPKQIKTQISEFRYREIVVQYASDSCYCPVRDAAIVSGRQLRQSRKSHERAMAQLKQAMKEKENGSENHG